MGLSGVLRGGVLLLLVVLFSLCLWFGTLAPAPELGQYHGEEELTADYSAYIDERVTVGGTVQSTSPVTIIVSSVRDDKLSLTVTNLNTNPDLGDYLQIFGVVREDHTIEAINAFVVPRTGLWYT